MPARSYPEDQSAAGESEIRMALPEPGALAHPEESLAERAENLKERIYVTFTALAVVIALWADRDHITPVQAEATLLITVVGTVLAVLTADLMSHLVVHSAMPTPPRVRHMLRVSLGAGSAAVLPVVFVGLAAVGVWTLAGALRASEVALLVALGVVGYLAVRRVRLPGWQRLLILLGEAVLGVAVIGLELLAHG